MERIDISKLQKNRSIFLKIGFIAALSVVIFAFEWTVNEVQPLKIIEPDLIIDEIVIERTAHQEERQLPPPKPKTMERIDLTPEPVFEPIINPNPIIRPDTPVVFVLPPNDNPPPLPKQPLFNPYENIEKDAPLIIAEVMPRFPGCEEDETLSRDDKQACANKKLLEFIGGNLKFPALAREADIQGTVVIRFIVEKDGSISSAEVVRDIGGGCGQEALRVVKKMPTWIPGSQQGHKVRVQFNLPIKFKLQ
ncbi:MAG: TonB family protein [Phaeodactylibacter sp.]|nr:TonB family protein [Phaeodactylibacter sp.]